MKKTMFIAAALMAFALTACGSPAAGETIIASPSADVSPEATVSQTADPSPSSDANVPVASDAGVQPTPEADDNIPDLGEPAGEGDPVVTPTPVVKDEQAPAPAPSAAPEAGTDSLGTDSEYPYTGDPIVYEGAIEDFLLPYDDYSWDRQDTPEMVMIHFISGVVVDEKDPYNLDTIRGIFENYHVSTHYLLDRDGTVYCYMPENRLAWHAGKGTYGSDKYTNKMNYYAIGIEVVAMGSKNDMAQYMFPEEYDALDPSLIGYTDAQYETLRTMVADICDRYNIPMDAEHVIGHDAYSPDKTDPGELFDWDRLLNG